MKRTVWQKLSADAENPPVNVGDYILIRFVQGAPPYPIPVTAVDGDDITMSWDSYLPSMDPGPKMAPLYSYELKAKLEDVYHHFPNTTGINGAPCRVHPTLPRPDPLASEVLT